MQKLNLGCGPIQPKGWQNVDGSLRAYFASRFFWLDKLIVYLRLWNQTEFNRHTIFVNLLKRLPWLNQSVDYVYLGEVLEHFIQEDGLRLLEECLRILKPGGIIRCRVPDNAKFWRNYLNEFDEIYKKSREEWSEIHNRYVQMFFRDVCVRKRLFSSFGHYHKWGYDEISLIKAFERIGFISVERREFLDSAISDIQKVENRGADFLIVEAIKPISCKPK